MSTQILMMMTKGTATDKANGWPDMHNSNKRILRNKRRKSRICIRKKIWKKRRKARWLSKGQR